MADRTPEEIAQQQLENLKVLAELTGSGNINSTYTIIPEGDYVGVLDPAEAKEGDSIIKLYGPYGRDGNLYFMNLDWKLPNDIITKYGTRTVTQKLKVDLIRDPLTGKIRFANQEDWVNANVELAKLLKVLNINFSGFKVPDLYYMSGLLRVVHEEDNRDSDKPVEERRVYARVARVSRLASF